MTDNQILTRSDLLVTEPTALEDFARATAFSALQQPVSGVAQLIDKTTGKTEHLKNVQFTEPCKEAKFGTTRWHAQAAGGAVGTLLPFAASLGMSRGLLGRTAAQSTLAAETGLGITLTEAACAGFINDSLFRPVDPSKSFVKERLLNGGIGAVNFTMLTATGLGLNKLGDYRALGLLKNPISIGLISGIPAGTLGANLESFKEHGKFASGEETLKSIYQMSFAGGALGVKQKLLGPTDSPATTVQPPQAKPEVLSIVLRTPEDAAAATVTGGATGSVVVRPTDLRPVEPVSAEQALKSRPPEEVTPQRKGPPPIPKETELPIADDVVELTLARASRPKRSAAPEKTPPKVEKTEPPLKDFYTKETNYKGIPIRAAECVSDQALIEAHRRIEMMLENAPEVVERLYEQGAEFYVIGKNQEVSDLPELRHWKGRPYDGDLTIDQRTRGVGGDRFSCSGEENLLKLPGDRYVGRDITVHEFAHTIHKSGLPPETMGRITARFEEAKTEGKWTGAYAIKNDLEYFAELTMWYFGGRGDYGKVSPEPVPGREWLRTYDPKGFELLDSIYRGKQNQPIEVSTVLKPLSSDVTGLKSSTGGSPIRLEVKNEGSKPAYVYWVSPEGKLLPYAAVQPNTTHNQPTFIGHYWKIGDKYYAANTEGAAAQVFIK